MIYKCDYHVVWVPKYRFRILKGAIKELVEIDIVVLIERAGGEVVELNVEEDHIHLLVSVPPKVSTSRLIGILKGKLTIRLFKTYPSLKTKPY